MQLFPEHLLLSYAGGMETAPKQKQKISSNSPKRVNNYTDTKKPLKDSKKNFKAGWRLASSLCTEGHKDATVNSRRQSPTAIADASLTLGKPPPYIAF